MSREAGRPPEWVRSVDRATIVRTCHGTTGGMSFEGASPHLTGDLREVFLGALRRDISACDVERARRVFRARSADDSVLAPETCTPWVDANAFGYYLKNVLPVVFVRTSHGELLPNARIAIKYLRENASHFSNVLDLLEHYAPRIFTAAAWKELRPQYPKLFTDVAQPYSAFSNTHMALGAGCYVMTPPGVATVIGPPTNQIPLLPLHSGLMESEWHHSELFVVFDCPEFSDQVMVIKPDTVLAQFSFVAKATQDASQVLFSEEDFGAEPAYRKRSIEVGLDLLKRGREFVLSRMTGVKSLSVACPHCWVSVTAAVEAGVPDDHVHVQDFYQGYKALRAEFRRAIGHPDEPAAKEWKRGRR